MLQANETTIEELRARISNPAVTPAAKAAAEKRLRELSKTGEPAVVPTSTTRPRKPYAGVRTMTVEEIVEYYSTGQFYRLDEPIRGVDALRSLYLRLTILGHEQEVIARVAEAIELLGGEVPAMEQVDISKLLPKKEEK